jgi:hypothetical protein
MPEDDYYSLKQRTNQDKTFYTSLAPCAVGAYAPVDTPSSTLAACIMTGDIIRVYNEKGILTGGTANINNPAIISEFC